MKLIDLLTPQRIILRLQATSRNEVLRELVQRGFTHSQAETGLSNEDENHIIRILEGRERLGSTGIKDGLAIPHGKIEGLSGITAAIGISHAGIDFGSLDHKPSKIFVVLLAPESANNQHLKALARISRLFSDHSLHKRILECQNEQDIYDLIVQEETRYP